MIIPGCRDQQLKGQETMKCKIAVIGVGQRGYAAVNLIKKSFSERAQLTALCDTAPERVDEFAAQLGVEDIPRFYTVDDLIAKGDFDAAIITVPDFAHRDCAIAVLNAGKHIMLEKPMALTAADCRDIIRAAERNDRIIQIGFVLRFHPVYMTAKKILASGEIGKVLNISASECLGVMHGASYMRRWHRKNANSGSFMLTKCSHDIDILSQVAGSRVARVCSFGSTDYFTPDKLKYEYCSECPDTSCRFRFGGEMVRMTDQEKAAPSVKRFDLCVYNDDKDVVDHQNTLMEFENGIKCDFSLNLFAPVAKRTLTVYGTDGYLFADTTADTIQLHFSDGRESRVEPCHKTNDSGHDGSDYGFMSDFIDCVTTGRKPTSDTASGLASTVVGCAIEKSRRSGQVVNIDPREYETDYED